MNRLVIIGNGFDLAHGLPTSYRDFIDDYFKKVINTLNQKFFYEDDFFRISIDFRNPLNQADKSKLDLLNSINDIVNLVKTQNKFSNSIVKKNEFIIKNNFFKTLCDLNSTQNWVDVENEYYKRLKETINIQKIITPSFVKKDNEREINRLNKEFEDVKNLLEVYLLNNVNNKFGIIIDELKEFINIFQSNTISGLRINKFYNEIPKSESDIYKKSFNKERALLSLADRKSYISEIQFENYFLSFNYTFTAKQYIQVLQLNPENLIEVHGSLFDLKNPINFGFGDEMDSHYKQIEEINDNEYLKNIKSFQYLHTPNYKRLLDLIDSEKFQVYIMGHSCGLSDRTLLNTIFEHENCCSIKIFYHQREDGTDNYTEITQNISRHFNKKKLMREKIVNKTLCKPLPQIQLPKKE